MVIQFYSMADPYNVLNKTLTYVKGFNNLPLKKDMDILTPVFEMMYDSAYVDINYMYIEDFHRYYFVKMEMLTGERVKIVGEVDVLMSWKEEILAQGNCVVNRNEEINSAYVNDAQVTLSAKNVYTVKKYPYTFDNQSIFILAAGGE